MNTVHRSGHLKQTNKSHKNGSHRSKRQINKDPKAKTCIKSRNTQMLKSERINRIKQIRSNKRNELLNYKRKFINTPFLVCVMPISDNVNPMNFLHMIQNVEPESKTCTFNLKYHHFNLKRFNQRFTFFFPDKSKPFSFLDALKVADTLLLVTTVNHDSDEDEIFNEEAHCLLEAACKQGLPSTTVAVMGIEEIAQKKRNDLKEKINELIQEYLPNEKVLPLSSDSDVLNLLRKIGNEKKKIMQNCVLRPYMLIEEYDFIKENENNGSLVVNGYLRNRNLSANSLVHIVGLGDYQIEKIAVMKDPFLLKKKESNMKCLEEIETTIYPDEKLQENLISERELDDMDVDQIWPTDDEIRDAEMQRKRKKIPDGCSSYQAAWIDEDDDRFINESINDSDSGSDSENDNEMDFLSCKSETETEFFDDTQTIATETEIDNDNYDKMNDYDAEKEHLRLMKQEKDDVQFPDEVDTPLDIPARDRFQKYRHLQSFRTSPWDFNENLPRDYARIFSFKNFIHTRNRIKKQLEKEDESEGTTAKAGSFVNVYLKNVNFAEFENFRKNHDVFVLIGMLPHEHKVSLMNVKIELNTNYKFPIKSKETLLIQCGYRRMTVQPLFSQHTNGNKFKYEKYFNPGEIKIASFYAPIQFPTATVLVFKSNEDQLSLIGSGSLLSCDPNRMIIKRIILSGYPFKINKKSAVIRFMFFNPEDIKYYKPCELKTKYGRIGHIKEALGTHGHMKCVFNGQLKSQDTVLLYLYKRIFPKWTLS